MRHSLRLMAKGRTYFLSSFFWNSDGTGKRTCPAKRKESPSKEYLSNQKCRHAMEKKREKRGNSEGWVTHSRWKQAGPKQAGRKCKRVIKLPFSLGRTGCGVILWFMSPCDSDSLLPAPALKPQTPFASRGSASIVPIHVDRHSAWCLYHLHEWSESFMLS